MTGALTTTQILTAWETGARCGPLDRAIAVLWAAGEPDDLAALPLIQRDRRLLELRQATFGNILAAVTDCPECGAPAEVELDARDLAEALIAPAPETIKAGDDAIQVRALTSRDLAAASSLPEDDVADFLRSQVTGGTNGVSTAVAAKIDALIEAREAAGEINISLTCADCEAVWSEPLDVASHLWNEIEAAALKVMAEVAEIAIALGWSESEILSMSDARRSIYLRIARGG